MSKFVSASLLALAMLAFAYVSPHYLRAQAEDCGNGLIQQMSVGARGWIIPEPPIPVNVRTVPGGDRVGQLQPGEMFDVVGGPQCYDTYSWWEVEADNGINGWIAEGTDAYFIEPLAVGGGGNAGVGGAIDAESLVGIGGGLDASNAVIIESRECEGEAQFAVGDVVEIINPTSFMVYYGHPALENAYFVNVGLLEYEESRPQYLESPYFITQQPYCVNGSQHYQIAVLIPVSYAMELGLYNVNEANPHWIAESDLTSTDEVIPYSPAFMLTSEETTIIAAPAAAPIVDLSEQLEYDIAGGGAGDYPLIATLECSLTTTAGSTGYDPLFNVNIPDNLYIGVENAGYDLEQYRGCLDIFPAPEGESRIRIIQPDGILYDEYVAQSRPIEVGLAPGAAVEYQFTAINGLRIETPRDYGLMEGLWQVEVQSGDTVSRYAYRLLSDALPRVQLFDCEGPHPRLIVYPFDVERDVELIYLMLDERVDLSDSIELLLPVIESGRWTIEVDAQPRELLEIYHLPPGSGFFAIASAGDDWQLEDINPTSAEHFQMSFVECPVTEETAQLDTGRLALGEGQFRFAAAAGDSVTVSARHYFDVINVVAQTGVPLRLIVHAPDGSVITSTDTFDYAEIRDVTLPVDGEYTLEVQSDAEDFFGMVGFLLSLNED
jgi:hypothetical protein